jgi:hypothetical protein
MQRLNEFRLYELAIHLHPLTLVDGELKYADVWYAWFTARSELDSIFTERPLSVALPAASKLYEAINQVVPTDFSEAVNKVPTDGAADVVIPSFRVFRIAAAAKEFETILAAELQAMDTYLVSQKGSYRTPDLIERAEIIFPELIRKSLPETAISDIRQAGRCLALDTPTAAGFHILRAIESVMAVYYNKVLSKPMPTRMRNWGIYIKKLEDSGHADAKITEFLKHIKNNYRNPITHPEVLLTSDEVEVLLGAATSAIRQMVLEIQRMDKKAAAALGMAGIMALPPEPEETSS